MRFTLLFRFSRSSLATIALTALSLSLLSSPPAAAQDVLFDVAQRKAELQRPEFAPAREYCAARQVDWPERLPEPFAALRTTEGYGTDQRAAPLAWVTMVLGGRALAGDAEAASSLHALLLQWAKAGALLQSDEEHDTYYALKRLMLPIIVNYGIIADALPKEDREIIEGWIGKIAPKLGKYFDGDVDLNNHRYLADSVLMAWGAFTGDKELYEQGVSGYRRALKDARADGSLPLETRRGSRANWYLQHSLASLTVMAEIAGQHGGDLFGAEENGIGLDHLTNYFLNSHYAPVTGLTDAADNYKPGPSRNYLQQDEGYLERREGRWHYMAFAEGLSRHPGFAAERLKLLLTRGPHGFAERPLIDEYAGGNATCFFWRPE